MEDIAQQLRRIEQLVVTLVHMQSPTMSAAEVGQVIGLRSRTAIRQWLKAKGFPGKTRRFDRARVIAAATQ